MKPFTGFANRYVRLSARHPFLLLLLLAALTALATVGTIRIFGNVRTNVRDLLPEDTPSRAALETTDERRGSSDLFVIAVESPDAYANIRMIEDLRDRVESEWDEAEWVQIDEDSSFFREHALLYLPVERLERFRDELKAALRCELGRVNPIYVDLSDACDNQEAVEWTLDYWLGDDLMRELGLPDEFFGSWDSELGGSDSDAEEEQPETEETAEDEPAPVEELTIPNDLGPYLIGIDRDRGTFISAMYVQLGRPSTDVDFANMMQQRGADLITALDPASYHPEMRAQVRGAYQNLNEAREAASDSLRALLASLAIVVLVMLVFFRAIRGLVVVLVPLVMGLAWTMGLSWFAFGELNLYTMFVGSVLLGMGIDFGIHLYGRAMEAFRRGEEWQPALVESLSHTGPALLAAAVTTIGALLTLLASHFKGFKEFGLIASYGVVFCLVAAYLVIPPLVFALEKIWPLKRREEKPQAARTTGRGGRKRWFVVALVAVAVVIVAGVFAPDAQFEHDFRNLRGKSSHGGIRYGKAVGRGKATSASIILGESPEQMREVHALLRQRFAAEDPMLKGFVTIETYVPTSQEARMGVIRLPPDDDDPFNRQRRNDIASVVERSALDRLEGDAHDFVEVVRDLVDVEPFALEDIPPWAYRSIREADGTVGALGLIFRSIQEWNVLECQAYQAEYGILVLESGDEVSVADTTFITADIVRTVKADGLRMALLVGGFLLFVLVFSLRSFVGALTCLLTLVAAFVVCLGAMVLTNTRIGMYNMIVLPAVLGVGIDGAIHIHHRFVEGGRKNMGRVMRTTGVAVLAASLTTAGGFAGLLFQNHLGIRSIGELALIGILAALAAVVFLMPAMLLLLAPPSGKEKS